VAATIDARKVDLGLLSRFGVASDQISTLRDRIHEGEKKRTGDQFAVDVYGRVTLGTLDRYAKELGVAVPMDALRALVAPAKTTAITVPFDPRGFPEPRVSFSEPRTFASKPGPVQLTSKDLPSASSLEPFLDAAVRTKLLASRPNLSGSGIEASELRRILTDGYGLARQSLTPEQIESLLLAASSKDGPAHTERDGVVDLSSRFQRLGGGAGVELYKKSAWEGISLHRQSGNKFSVSGFPVDKVVVVLPKGASLFLQNSEGDQTGLRIPAKQMEIDGKMVRAVEIDRAMVRPFGGQANAKSTPFTVKVLDADSAPIFEQALQFHDQQSWTSKTIAEGTIGYRQKPEDVADRHYTHFVPSPKTNSSPVGERPLFHLGQNSPDCDQLLFKRDGETFAVNRFKQLLYPPKGSTQTIPAKLGAEKQGVYQLAAASIQALDSPDYDPEKSIRIKSSYGHPATMNLSLSQTDYLEWTYRGATVYAAGTRTPKAELDPLA
jgi:hypothetical protein